MSESKKLPPLKETDDAFEKAAGVSVDVVIRLKGGDSRHIARYINNLEQSESMESIRHQRDSAIGCLRSIVTEWNRQKELFPEIKKDGWMDSLIDGAHGLLMNIEGES